MKSVNHPSDDSFQLYDLLVEVVCPPGERILCGAKPGDNFRLEGEMLYLPSGQGFSIYSLGEYGIFNESPDIPSMHMVCRCDNATIGGKAKSDPSERLDVDRC